LRDNYSVHSVRSSAEFTAQTSSAEVQAFGKPRLESVFVVENRF
jgi:hypothetical protein